MQVPRFSLVKEEVSVLLRICRWWKLLDEVLEPPFNPSQIHCFIICIGSRVEWWLKYCWAFNGTKSNKSLSTFILFFQFCLLFFLRYSFPHSLIRASAVRQLSQTNLSGLLHLTKFIVRIIIVIANLRTVSNFFRWGFQEDTCLEKKAIPTSCLVRVLVLSQFWHLATSQIDPMR